MYLKMALGQAFLCSPKLWHLKFSVLGLWSPAIRGGNWARVCGQNRLEALRPGHSAGPSLCLPWQSGRLTHYNRVNCFIFLLNTNGPVPHRPFLKANAFLGTLKNHSREEAIVDQNQGWPGTLTCNHRESRALSKDKLPASPLLITAQKYWAESLKRAECFFRWKELSFFLSSASKPFMPLTKVSPDVYLRRNWRLWPGYRMYQKR